MESRRRSQNKKPPRGSWQPTVPSWEKTFCKVVGSLDWETLMDMKKFVHLYDNIINWNDSAGEEAFHSAKNRFWAQMHGLPCENNLPDPDLYIDNIDWESKIDPELLSDLECKSLVPDLNEKQETVVIFGDSLMPNQSFSPAGWGETEEKLKKATNSSLNNQENPWELSRGQNNGTVKENGQGDYGNDTWLLDNGGGPMRDTGWETGWDNSCVASKFENNKVENENQKHRSFGNNEAWGMWDVSQRKRGNAARYMSRYKVSRFPRESHHNNYTWRNGKGTKGETRVWE